MARPDPHSYFDDSQPRVTHVDWRADISFDVRSIKATATLTLEGTGPTLDLDSNGLQIQSISDAEGNAIPFEQSDADPVLGQRLRLSLSGPGPVVVEYLIPENASALQWLQPAQTAGDQPFLFTQCQAIHARSVLPVQDSPSARITFEARLTVPKVVRGLMAAGFVDRAESGDEAVEHWKMPQPIAPYLFAFAVGDLVSKDLGPRTRLWAEPAVLDKAAWEFEEVDEMLRAGEKLFGPYDWDRYDFLVMPPSFPYGGMENPRLTFLTPSLLTGDRSQVAVLAHELAHSWTGNLITNASAEDFWLNEGWTRYAEQRIVEAVYGVEEAELLFSVGNRSLLKSIEHMEAAGKGELTKLKTQLEGVHPDDAFSVVPYEKGLLYLRSLEEAVGREAFDGFVQKYIAAFRFQSITTETFLSFLDKELPDGAKAVDRDAWCYQPGLPDAYPKPRTDRVDHVLSLVGTLPEEDLSANEWQLFFESSEALTPADCQRLDARQNFTKSQNLELATSWLELAIKSGYEPALPRAVEVLGATGRMKFLKPLYAALLGHPDGAALARATFNDNRHAYHPIAVAGLEQLLAQT